MDMNEDVLKGWLSYKPIEDGLTKNLLLKQRDEFYKEYPQFNDNNYFNLMPNCNINFITNELRFSKCATDFINELFKRYVDDETLVISTTDEHDNVKKCLNECKNTLILNYNDEVMNLDLSRIDKEVSKYKKIFVYIIGTQISTGEITPQLFFEKLKQKLINKKSIITLDDVHGMFLFPRDYRLFDFILYTAHALIKGYDMGLLICKSENEFDFGSTMCNWAIDYFGMLKVILERRDKMFMFRTIMENYFADLLSTENFSSLNRTSPHIFSMLVKGIKFSQSACETLNNYKIRIENGGEKTYVRFRAQHYIQKPELLIEGVQKFRFITNTLLDM